MLLDRRLRNCRLPTSLEPNLICFGPATTPSTPSHREINETYALSEMSHLPLLLLLSCSYSSYCFSFPLNF